MKNTSTFQIILICVFAAAIIGALILFATSHSGKSNTQTAVTIWGTASQTDFSQVLEEYSREVGTPPLVTYVQKQPGEFNQDLIEALADGDGPNAIMLPQDSILQFADKIYPIPYTSYPALTFQNTFITEASLYETKAGIIGFPISVDPLVMYWNKDMLNSAGVAAPPATWDQFYAFAQKFTQSDKGGNITQSAVALGGYANITNAGKIISALLLQAGNPITISTNVNGVDTYESVLSDGLGYSTPPAQSALTFYTEFSNPAKPDYSWNAALPDSLDQFAEGDLAVYFGLASDYNTIMAKNPNLNFAVSALPQPLGAKTKLTFGQMDALAVLKSSPNISGVFTTLSTLFGSKFASLWAAQEGVAPARIDLLSVPQTSDAATQLFYDSALISRAWLDPDPVQTDAIFQKMVNTITSGADTVDDAVTTASSQLNLVIQSDRQQ